MACAAKYQCLFATNVPFEGRVMEKTRKGCGISVFTQATSEEEQ